jgi:hypothetical protein
MTMDMGTVIDMETDIETDTDTKIGHSYFQRRCTSLIYYDV